jgi:preprotein translocase subunit SecG
MHIDLRPFLALWLVVIAAVIVVAFWRRSVAVQEDPALHLGAAHAGTAAQQIAVAKKLEHIDKWMKILTVVAVVFGLLLGAAALYKAWVLGPGAGL